VSPSVALLRLLPLFAASLLVAGCGSDVRPSEASGGGHAADVAASSASGFGGGAGEGGGGGGVEGELDPAPGGMRRLLPRQVVGSIEVLFGPSVAAAIDDVPAVPQLHGFSAIGASEIALAPTDVSQLEAVAALAAELAVLDRERLAQLAPCIHDDGPPEACYDEVAREVGRLAWRRPLDDDERARLVAVGEAGRAWAADGDLDDPFGAGLKYELMAMLQSPSFLYLVEIGEPDPEHPGWRRLSPYELASRMSFFLHGRTPDAALLDAADAGELDTDAGVRAVATALLARDEARDALDAFYAELLYLDDLSNVSKDPALFPEFDGELTASMRAETLAFLRDLVWDRDADAREMFTATETFVDARLAALYGIESPGEELTRVALPPDQERSGVLGHASFLTRFAHPGLTSPTRRGNLVASRFLCDEVPPPPPGVNPTLPEDPDGEPETMRDKLQRHQEDPTCASCHVYMDPIGLALEHFDSIGEWRATDRGMAIDTAGEVDGLGAFAGPRELGERLAGDVRVPRCMVKNLVRASLGHLETTGERWEVRRLADGFVEDGHHLQALMVELVASPAFRWVGEPK
jgi:hypothetical protein